MTPETIFTAITAVFPVTLADITGPHKRRNEVDARYVAAHLLYNYGRMSNRQIGDMLGRCASSISCARERFTQLYAADKSYRVMVDKVIGLLGVTAEVAG